MIPHYNRRTVDGVDMAERNGHKFWLFCDPSTRHDLPTLNLKLAARLPFWVKTAPDPCLAPGWHHNALRRRFASESALGLPLRPASVNERGNIPTVDCVNSDTPNLPSRFTWIQHAEYAMLARENQHLNSLAALPKLLHRSPWIKIEYRRCILWKQV